MVTQNQIYKALNEQKVISLWPDNVSEIMDILSRPEQVDISELADSIEQSNELMHLLKHNLPSSDFVSSSKIHSPKDALLLLGIQSFRNMLLFFLVHSFCPQNIKNQRARHMTQFCWDHALSTAIAAEEIAIFYGMENKETYLMFTYGLIHDIGHLIVEYLYPQEMDGVLQHMQEGATLLEAERAQMDGLTHQEIGAMVCTQAGFSDRIITAVRHHHGPYEIENPRERLRILAVADALAYEFSKPDLPDCPEYALEERWVQSLHLTSHDLEKVRRRLVMRFERYGQAPLHFVSS